LKKYGIIARIDLPVGENYQDHLMVNMNFGLTSDAQGMHLSAPFFDYCNTNPLQAALNVIPVTSDAKPEPGKE
jgi:hypothetical protein